MRPAAVVAVLLALPLVACGAATAWGTPGLAKALPLESCLEVELGLAAAILVGAWPLSRGARELELFLAACAATPLFFLARAFTRVEAASADRALAALLGLAVAVVPVLMGLARAGVARETVVAVGLGTALFPPIVGALARDLGFARLAQIELVSPGQALVSVARGGDLAPLLAHAVALGAIGLVAWLAGRHRPDDAHGRQPWLVVPLLLGAAGLAFAARPAERSSPAAPVTAPVAIEEIRVLLGNAIRPSVPSPLRLVARGGAAPFDGWLGVRAGGRLYATRVTVAPAARVEVALAPILVPEEPLLPIAWRDDESPSPLRAPAAPAPAPLPGWIGVLGLAGTRADPLRRELARVSPASRTQPIDPLDVDLLPAAAGVLDAVVASPDVARAAAEPLAAYAAAGGVVVLQEPSLLASLAGTLAAPGDGSERALGGGVLVAASETESAGLAKRVAAHLVPSRRLAPDGLARAASLAAPPGPSRGFGARGAIAAMVLALSFALVVAATQDTTSHTLTGASLFALVSVVALLISGSAPASHVFADTLEVLEAPAGGVAAERTQVIRFAAARRQPAKVTLAPGVPPVPLEGAAPGGAVLSSSPAPGEAWGEPELRFDAGLRPAAFVRRAALALEGPITVERAPGVVRLTNGTGLSLGRLVLVGREGVRVIGDAAPGATTSVDLVKTPAIDFLAHRRRSFDATPEGRARGALLEAVLTGRRLAGAHLIVGFVANEPDEAVRAGVAEAPPSLVRAIVIETRDPSP